MQPEKRQWLEWIEPWYLVYALMGVVVAGLVPVLIPLIVNKIRECRAGGPGGGGPQPGRITSPLWGGLADRYRAHRILLAGGMLFASLGLAAFAFTSQPPIWILLAIITGLGSRQRRHGCQPVCGGGASAGGMG